MNKLVLTPEQKMEHKRKQKAAIFSRYMDKKKKSNLKRYSLFLTQREIEILRTVNSSMHRDLAFNALAGLVKFDAKSEEQFEKQLLQ